MPPLLKQLPHGPGKTSRWQTKPCANFNSNALGLAERRLHPPRRGPDARIAEVHGVGREGPEGATQLRQRGVMRLEKIEEVLELMSSWRDEAQLL
jgi:hypothetical protein